MDGLQAIQVYTPKGVWQAQFYVRLTHDGKTLIKDGEKFIEIKTVKRFTPHSGLEVEEPSHDE